MSDPLVAPPENAGDSDAPGEEGLPAGSLLGSGPQNATAPGADPGEAAPDDDAALAAPAGDPGGSASDLGSSTDAGSLSGSEFGPESSSDPMPDPSDAAPS
jgi:hypothetical protein